jgi:hypothetical protein
VRLKPTVIIAVPVGQAMRKDWANRVNSSAVYTVLLGLMTLDGGDYKRLFERRIAQKTYDAAIRFGAIKRCR